MNKPEASMVGWLKRYRQTLRRECVLGWLAFDETRLLKLRYRIWFRWKAAAIHWRYFWRITVGPYFWGVVCRIIGHQRVVRMDFKEFDGIDRWHCFKCHTDILKD
jgi:hypothetical protein